MLTGSGGQDTFLFDNKTSVDIVTDFDSNDAIYLSTDAFNLPADLALTASNFYVGTAAHDADDRIIFNPSTHALYYDADGAGGAAQAQFAVINGTDVPTASDIIATAF